MCKVSVVMPSLNVVSYIDEAITSVRNQTLKNIEIICVDAGSTDGTWELLEKHAGSDGRIRLIKTDTRSYGYQMNLGIKAAKGEYVGIVETDDFIDNAMFEKLYCAGKAHDAEIVKSDFDMFITDDSGHRLHAPFLLKKHCSIDYDTVYSGQDYISNRSKIEIYIWNAIYKKSFLKKNNVMFNETPGASFQDFSFRYQACFSATSIIAVNHIGYHYRRDNSDASTYNPHTVEYNLRESKYSLDKMASINNEVYSALAREIVEFASWPYIEMLKWIRPSEETRDAFVGYVNLLRRFEEDKIITKENSKNDLLWKDYNLMLQGADFFMTYASVISKLDRERVSDYLKELEKHTEIVIFGASSVGDAAYIFLKNTGFNNIKSFCDNNENVQGKRVYGIDVLSVREATETYKGALYILTSARNEVEMRKQLVDLGVDNQNMVLYTLPTDPAFCTNCMVRNLKSGR